jgi:hypothetical protein
VIYNGIEIKICANATKVFCKWEDWKEEITQNYVLADFFEACGNDKLDVVAEDKYRAETDGSLLGVKVIIWIFCLEIFILACVCWGKSKSTERIAETLLIGELNAQEEQALKDYTGAVPTQYEAEEELDQ